MYNKLFTKILDSSIWLAPDPHRLVWITLIAAMDQNGMAQFACAANLAARARVSLADTEKAIAAFEAPDPHDPTQDYDGRRIERVPGGWFVLNAEKYRSMVTRAVASEQSRERMRRYREKLRNVTQPLQPVTPSDAVSVSVSVSDAVSKKKTMSASPPVVEVFEHWKTVHKHPQSKLDAKRHKLIVAALSSYSVADLCQSITGYRSSPHHMGQNDKATVYDDIELMLRDAKHIDAGLKFAAAPPRTELSALTRKNVAATDDWVPPEMRNATG